MAYSALHPHNSPYSQPLQHLQPVYGQSQNHQVPIQSLRRHVARPPQQQQTPQQQQQQLPQTQQHQHHQQQHFSPLIQQQQLTQSPQFQPQSIAPPPSAPPTTPAPSSSASSAPIRGSPLGQHSDAIYAPQAALLYSHANAIAAAQAAQANGADGGYSSGGSTPPRLPPILQVEKQQVTTSATQAASASRRRNEAHFICPVPGCGSTFTRRFNLRGPLCPAYSLFRTLLLLSLIPHLKVICGHTRRSGHMSANGQAAIKALLVNMIASE